MRKWKNNNCEGPRVPEVAELQGGLVGDADECVPLLTAPPREGGSHHGEVCEAQTTAGGVVGSLGLEPDTPRVARCSSFWLAPKSQL